jgi:hypothetical protein
MKSSKTEAILTTMNVLAWITFFGLLIKAGVILVSYSVSVANPEGAKNLYMGLNLSNIREYDFWHYTGVVSLLVAVLLFEAYTAYLVTKVLSKIKMTNPFTLEVVSIMEKISYCIFATWVVVMFYNAQIGWLAKKLQGLQVDYISGEFIFLAGVVFVFSQIFKKGVEIQSENELTV